MFRMAVFATLVFTVSCTLSLSACSKKADSPDLPPQKSHDDAASIVTKPATQPSTQPQHNYTEIDWTDLLPDDDLQALENPPDYLSDIADGSEADQLTSQLKAENNTTNNSPEEDRYQQALNSKKIRPEFDGRHIRIPGFIVPLQFGDMQTITTFFLVPFFGACIHMPPPPPNQIIYAEYEPGIKLESLYDPFWINGTLSTTLMENDMATAAYSMSVSNIEPYYDMVPIDDIEQGESEIIME